LIFQKSVPLSLVQLLALFRSYPSRLTPRVTSLHAATLKNP
jgi:hypothetical protein